MKRNRYLLPIGFLLALLLCRVHSVSGQTKELFGNLPIGKYAVGFKIITVTDDSRVSKAEYNYLGEKNEGDLAKKITIHLWYPASDNSGKRTITFEDYCYNNILSTTNETVSDIAKNGQVNRRRTSVEGWFGKATDEAWRKLLATPMLAKMEASPLKEKFPLLLGMLRPLSTSVTNEFLASHGYVIAMISNSGTGTFAEGALREIPDLQYALRFLEKNESVDVKNTGAFGFSGSGFTQVLFTMYDYRVKALADLESGIYMENLFQALSASNYYDPSRLRVPFLHIFSRDLSKQEKYIDEFEKKAKFSKRYRLILNQPALHHWDFAAEGYTSTTMLKNRGEQQLNIQHSFEIASIYLLNFFNAELKSDTKAKEFLSHKPALSPFAPALWDITVAEPIKPAPNRDEFEYIIRKKGIADAITMVRNTLKNDSATNITQGFVLNNLGYTFLNEKKYDEAIGVFKLNTELHPLEANFFDSLAESYEVTGDKESMKRISGMVLSMLIRKGNLTDAEKNLKESAEKRVKN